MELNEIIAENLKRLRTERGLSLGRLAELSGVSKVMLSQVEKGESSPTINTLWKIATGLQVPYTQLIDIQATKPFFVPKAESALVDDGKGYRVYHYNRAEGSRDFEFFNSELDTGASFTSEGHGTHTRESVLVTAGELVLVLETVEYVMAEGDFIQFDFSRPHTYINRGEVMTVFTNIVYYEG